MRKSASLYKRHRFPPDIIQYAVWLYYRFNLSQRAIEELLAERGIIVSYESIRLWCNKFGPTYSRRLKRHHKGFGDTFYIDEVFVNIRCKRHYLWRAVEQDGEVVDVFLQKCRNRAAAKRFFKRLLKAYHHHLHICFHREFLYKHVYTKKQQRRPRYPFCSRQLQRLLPPCLTRL